METNPLERLYGVFVKQQTYINIFYLLLAFPLGIAYFVFLVSGFSLGFSLIILWVGILILAGVLALCWPLALFERQMAISLLRAEMPPLQPTSRPGGTLFQQFKSHLANAATWKGIAFLLLKFPIGIVDFSVTVTLLAFSAGLLLAPISYPWVQFDLGFTRLHSLPAAMIAFVLGLIIAPLSLHGLNILADWQRRLAQFMLGGPQSTLQPQPVSVQAAQEPSTTVV